jgi:hypothetical protein
VPTPCYLLEPTEDEKRWLRRYVRDHEGGDYTCAGGWHEALAAIENGHALITDDGLHRSPDPDAFAGDPRWPTGCDGCGRSFAPDDHRQVLVRRIYRVASAVPGAAASVGDFATIEDAPPGAMWYADWMGEWAHGPDGRTLVVKLPDGHQWTVDAEATNCTRKGDRAHKCWIRNGEPPMVTVGKDGETCAAGAGSIASPGYHGFLRAGVLT